jgi:DNA primase
VIAPLIVRDRWVSYVGRDITGMSSMKYRPCPKEKEAIAHKSLLYGAHLVPDQSVLVVEGITDAWRMGPGAVALFGQKTTPKQMLALSRFERIFVMLDEDAQRSADRIAANLAVLGREVEVWKIAGDPADMAPEEADKLSREFLGPKWASVRYYRE